jgi:Cu/Ag efflux protein CusF
MKNKNHIMKAGLVAAGALALMGGPLFASQTCSRLMHDQGTIRGIESKNSKLTILDRHDAVLRLHWDQQTRFLMQNKAIQPTDLKPGERVMAAYVKTDKNLVARTIRVLPEHAMAPGHAKTTS